MSPEQVESSPMPPSGQTPLPYRLPDVTLKHYSTITNRPAHLSYFFGIFGLVPLVGLPLSVAAIILGIIGLVKVKRNPAPGANMRALVGMLLGVFEVVELLVLIGFAMFVRR